jgi:hypothetical protein
MYGVVSPKASQVGLAGVDVDLELVDRAQLVVSVVA